MIETMSVPADTLMLTEDEAHVLADALDLVLRNIRPGAGQYSEFCALRDKIDGAIDARMAWNIGGS